MTQLSGLIEKKWGSELIFATNDRYTGKLLNFKTGSKFSMHFHAQKDESWFVLTGKFLVEFIDTKNATVDSKYLNVGDTWRNQPLFPHRLTCVEEGTIIEVSTPDSVEDNYRVMPGDNQSEICSLHR